MGELADKLNSMKVKAQSHDGNLRAILDKAGFVLGVRPGAYHDYEADELAYQLKSVLRKMEVKYRKSYQEITEAFGVTIVVDPRLAVKKVQRDYLTDAANVVLVGVTSKKLVRVRAQGMRSWECRVAPNLKSELSEEEFVEEVNAAVNNLVNKYRQSLKDFKKKHYQVGW